MVLFGPPDIEKLKARRDVDGLIKALSYQESGQVRRDAVRALGELRDALAEEPLIAALKDEEPYVRSHAAEALGKIGDAHAVEPLIAALKEEKAMRTSAAEALGRIGNARAVEPLIAVLKDKETYVRKYAAEALGKIGTPAVEPLIAALKDKATYVRDAAAETLGKIGWQPGKDEAGAVYWIAKRNWEECVRIGAPAVEPLIDRLNYEAAAVAWGKIGDAHAVEPIIAALGKIGTPAVEPLIAALKDKDTYVRRAAAETLDKIGWQPGKDETGAAYWIGKRNWEECVRIGAPAVEPLIAALKEEGMRESAAMALGKIGDAHAVEPLIAVLKDNHAVVRRNVAEALVSLYRVGQLDETDKKLILAHRPEIRKPHLDANDCAGRSWGGRGHTDSAAIEFPL